MATTSQELKIGLLVIAALGALGWLSVQSGSFGLSSGGAPTRALSAVFADVNGITTNSKVKMAGVEIGQVDAVQLQPNGTAVLKLLVRRNVALPADVTAQVTSNGLIGEQFVALVPGPAGALGQGGSLSPEATMIPSSGVADTQAIGTNFAKVADDLSAMTTTLRQVLGSPENAQKLQGIIDGLSGLASTLNNNNGVLADLEHTMANFRKISDDLAQGKGTLGQLLAGGQGSGTAGGAMGSLADLGNAAKELQQVMAKINNGQGTLGKLVNDPQTAEKLNDALDSFGAFSDRIEQVRTELAFEGTSYTGEDAGGGSFALTVAPRPTRFYELGVNADGFSSQATNVNDRSNPYFGKDFGKDVKFTAQFGHVIQNAVAGQDVALRVGLKNTTGGVGLDTYGKLPKVGSVGGGKIKYSADVYDFGGNDTPGSDTPRVDLTARADLIGNTVYGVVGYDNMLNQEYGSPKIGVGVKFQDDDLKYLVGSKL
jgi:phospholipid/cholesterol/gamma-HCH transport system substrate-binding protein